jgi:hypothetical protein
LDLSWDRLLNERIPLSVVTLCVHSLRSWASLNYSPLRFDRRDLTLAKITSVQKYVIKMGTGFQSEIFVPRGPQYYSVCWFKMFVCSASRTLRSSSTVWKLFIWPTYSVITKTPDIDNIWYLLRCGRNYWASLFINLTAHLRTASDTDSSTWLW